MDLRVQMQMCTKTTWSQQRYRMNLFWKGGKERRRGEARVGSRLLPERRMKLQVSRLGISTIRPRQEGRMSLRVNKWEESMRLRIRIRNKWSKQIRVCESRKTLPILLSSHEKTTGEEETERSRFSHEERRSIIWTISISPSQQNDETNRLHSFLQSRLIKSRTRQGTIRLRCKEWIRPERESSSKD